MSFNTVFQYYSGNIKDSKPKGVVTLHQFVDGVANPKPKMRDLLHNIRNAETKAEKDKMKIHLPAFTPCVHINPKGKRKYDDVIGFSGLLSLDFDGIANRETAADFKHNLFEAYPFILACWLSSSGKGVRGLVRIPECKNIDEFKARFRAIEKIMRQFNGFDIAPKNCVLPLFYSYDPKIRFNYEAILFEDIEYEQEEAIVSPASWVKPSDKFHRWSMENTEKAISKITDNGHPQLRAAAYCLGGYVGSGYISETEAIGFINSLIDSNKYLSKKPDVYKATAKTMIRKGQSQPVRFKE